MMVPESSSATVPTPVGPGGRFLSRLLVLGSWSYLAAALGLWLLLQWADLWWPASIFLFAPRSFCALPLLVLFPAALLLRRKRLLIPLSVAGAIMAGPVMGLCIPWRTLLTSPPAGPRLRVMTCNLHYSNDEVPPGLEAYLEEYRPDVVALQEWRKARESEVGKGPGWYRDATPRLLLASRYPIRRVVPLGLSSYGPTGSVTRYDLETPAGLVYFFSLHLASPREGIKETIQESDLGPEGVRGNIARRWQQSRYVALHSSGLPGPVLLAGDFNTPPESAIFREVWGDYTDAFSAGGLGWGYTFIGGKTVVRIDHILASKGWYCERCRVGPHVGSPHRPVLADLIWTGPAGEEPTAPSH